MAIFVTLICLEHPEGPQPATYDHLQTLVNLIDEWHHRMFWGHKGERGPYNYAGTASHQLPRIIMSQKYGRTGYPSGNLSSHRIWASTSIPR
jgi:hypothetical protein